MKKQWAVQPHVLLALIGVLCVFGSSILYAQPGMGRRFNREQIIDNRMTLLKDRLDLTKDQVAAIQPLVAGEIDSIMSIRQRMAPGDATGRQQMFQAMTALREQTDQKISALLTQEQQQKFQALRQEQMERRRNRMGGGGRMNQ